MNLLIIGGTGFVGRHLTEVALARGHTLTLFNRGQSEPDLFADVEAIVGDRSLNHNNLKGRQWDAAIDTNGRMPAQTIEAGAILKDAVEHFTFISSISAYADLTAPLILESAATSPIEANEIADTSDKTYGKRKAECERIYQNLFRENLLLIRPGLIVGPYDVTDRFTYWPVRVAEGGLIVAPCSQTKDEIQFIDVRDLAEWTITMIENKVTGAFNAVGFKESLTIQQLLEECKNACNPSAEFKWLSAEYLNAQKISPWMDMPTWAPSLGKFSNQKAVEKNLTFRPIKETILDTLNWAKKSNKKRPLKAGLSAEREHHLLETL